MNARDQQSILSFAQEVAAAMKRLSDASDKYEAKVDALEKRVDELSAQIAELKGMLSPTMEDINNRKSGSSTHIYEVTTTAAI